MREVTAVGPHIHDGKSYVKGDKMMMSDTDADWYAKTIVEGRRVTADNPMIAAISTPVAPADATAAVDVETRINSDERTGDTAADALRDQVLLRNEVPANADETNTATSNQTTWGKREDARATAQTDATSKVEQ